jgi:hypothetical protein
VSFNAHREELAKLEHDQWCLWTRYMLDALQPLLDTYREHSATERETALRRLAGWWRQVALGYDDLTEAEKESDREWADKALAIVEDP